MTYNWHFRIMRFAGQPQTAPKHPAEREYIVRQQISEHLASFLSLTDTLAYAFVPEDVKKAVRTVMGCHRFAS